MNRRIVFILRILLCSLFVSQITLAEEVTKGIPVGPAQLYPNLRMAFKHDSNILQQPANETSSFIIIFQPKARLELEKNTDIYALTVGSEAGRYQSSSDDNYLDGYAGAEAKIRLTQKADAELQANYYKGHDPRGTTDLLESGEPIQWYAMGAGGTVGYGRKEATARLEAKANVTSKRYQDLPSEDKTMIDTGVTFFYRILPKTHVLFEIDRLSTDYKSSESTLDNDRISYLVGATWYATQKTSGTVKVGYSKRTFDEDSREDTSDGSWQANVQWRPLTYSLVDFSTAQYTDNPTGFGDYVLNRDIGVAWTYAWGPRLSTTLNFLMSKREFGGNTGTIARVDDKQDLNLIMDYKWRRWLDVKLGMSLMKRDSTIPNNDYDRRVFTLTLDAKF